MKLPKPTTGNIQEQQAGLVAHPVPAFTDDGDFRTGDVGPFDDKAFLKIVDRKKDMPTGCPGVAECACIGVADDKTGEAAQLFVVKAQNATLTETEVIAFCRKQLTGYKVPKGVCIVDALPRSTVGKNWWRELRDVK